MAARSLFMVGLAEPASHNFSAGSYRWPKLSTARTPTHPTPALPNCTALRKRATGVTATPRSKRALREHVGGLLRVQADAGCLLAALLLIRIVAQQRSLNRHSLSQARVRASTVQCLRAPGRRYRRPERKHGTWHSLPARCCAEVYNDCSLVIVRFFHLLPGVSVGGPSPKLSEPAKAPWSILRSADR